MNIVEQIKVNLLAVISLVVALTALSYNTYRNELTEENRNIRDAGFELLVELNKLQLLIDFAYYNKNPQSGNPIKGWSHVLYIHDLSKLVSLAVESKSLELKETWRTSWDDLGKNESSNEKLTQNIKELRAQVLMKIKALD